MVALLISTSENPEKRKQCFLTVGDLLEEVKVDSPKLQAKTPTKRGGVFLFDKNVGIRTLAPTEPRTKIRPDFSLNPGCLKTEPLFHGINL